MYELSRCVAACRACIKLSQSAQPDRYQPKTVCCQTEVDIVLMVYGLEQGVCMCMCPAELGGL